MHPSEVKALNRFWDHFCENAPTPETQKQIFKEIYNKLQTQYPDWDNYQLNYWTARIAFFTDWDINFELTMDNSEEPRIIHLSFNPCY